ncbi:hypothetical protein S83_067528 [Arachis hypogaea]
MKNQCRPYPNADHVIFIDHIDMSFQKIGKYHKTVGFLEHEMPLGAVRLTLLVVAGSLQRDESHSLVQVHMHCTHALRHVTLPNRGRGQRYGPGYTVGGTDVVHSRIFSLRKLLYHYDFDGIV